MTPAWSVWLPDEVCTRRLGAALASALRPGDVLALCGPLGTGKTTFTQGVAAALGVEEPVRSPTFAIRQELRGRLPIVHLDLYRIQGPIFDLDVEGDARDGAIVLVEWADRAPSLLPPWALVVELTVSGTGRRACLWDGADPDGWWRDLDPSLGPWEPAVAPPWLRRA